METSGTSEEFEGLRIFPVSFLSGSSQILLDRQAGKGNLPDSRGYLPEETYDFDYMLSLSLGRYQGILS